MPDEGRTRSVERSKTPASAARDPSIDILLCTFRRDAVGDTLRSLDAQTIAERASLRVVVIDNDDVPTARARVSQTADGMRVPVHYCHAPARNISLARNAGLDAATRRGVDWVAFIDDDETADPDWLAELLNTALACDADAVFGPSLATYGPEAPGWMRRQDLHSNRPQRRGGTVQTGHTCNALLRWGDVPWRDHRFDLARGRAGGEDTAYFFQLHAMGARFEICEAAHVREDVPDARQSFAWLARRRFRSGQSYVAVSEGAASRVTLALSAAAKIVVCAGGAVVNAWSVERRNYWLLRGALHAGVVAGCLALRQPEIYGSDGNA